MELYDSETYLEVSGELIFVDEPWVTEDSTIKSLYTWQDPEEVPICIAIVGSAGVGKRKLAHALGQELDLPTISGVARSASQHGVELDKDSEWLDTFMILMAQVWQEREYEQFVTAGSIVELVAHAHYHAHCDGGTKELTALRELVNFANSFINAHYSVLFYLPYKNCAKDDGTRSVDHEYNIAIDKLIVHYLKVFDLDYFPVKGRLPEQRRLCLDYLTNFGLVD